MSDETTSKEGKAEEAKAQAADEPTYHRDRLVEQAHEFCGVTPAVMTGALSAEKKQTFTRAEAEAAVKKWLRRPAGTSKPVEEG